MGIYIQGILLIFASVGLYLILDRFGRPAVRILLSGPLNRFYLQYLQSSTKFEFDAASAADNYDRAWDGIVFQKVYEMGVSGVSYSKRKQHLEYITEYIKAVSKPKLNRKIADELIKVLPKQYRNVDFQKKLACFICELLSNVEHNNHDGKSLPIRPIPSIAIDALTSIISAWIAGIVYLLLSLYVLDKYPPVLAALSNLALFILMVLPLFKLIGSRLAKFTTVSTIASIMVLFLGSFATIAHGRTQLPLIINLTQYENPNSKLLIQYPEWLTMNNTGCNGKKVSIFLQGQLTTPIEFRSDNDYFYFTSKDCLGIIPRLEITQSESQAYEFYVIARDNTPFFSDKKNFTIIPQYILGTIPIDMDPANVIPIQIENWFWNFVNNLSLKIGSLGLLIVLYATNFFINKRMP
jgi:hypothetical protein